jgi:hypothetical protein
MVWITYKFARVEQNCGRKGGLFNRLRIVETKACFRNLGDLKRSRRLRCDPCPGCEKFGCEDVWSYESQNVEDRKRVRVNSLIYKTSNDGLSEFYD